MLEKKRKNNYPMKILFVCENYYPHYGGAEVLFKNLAEGLIKKGNKVVVITTRLSGTKKFEEINGVKVHRINCFNNRYLFSFLSIPKVLTLAKRADVLQTTTFNGAPPAWLAAKLAKKPVLLTVHEVWIGKWKQVAGFSWLKSKLHDFLERMIYIFPFDKYICVSDATKKDLLNQGIEPKKAVTVYNGFDYTFWDQKKFSKAKAEQLRKELNLEKKFVCLSWGRPGGSKGFEYLLKAVPFIKKSVPNAVILLMLGSPEKYKKKYQKLKKLAHKHREKVKIIPSLPYQQLGTMIRAADCVIIPSLSEGFGYNALETNSLGTPLIASSAGSLPEVVSGKHLFFQSKDLQDLAEKVALVEKGKWEYLPPKKFTWGDCVDGYLQCYNSVKFNVP